MILRLLVAFSIFVSPLLATAQLTDFSRQEISYKNVLAPFNSGFESGTSQWTASGGTFASVTAGSNLLEGKGSTTWNSNSASQTLTSKAVTISNGRFGNNCEASILMQTPSGTATHLFQAWDGTNVLASMTVVSSTLPRIQTVNFPCGTSGTYAMRLVSVASDEPLIALDEAYLGLARNVGSTQLITEWQSFTPTGVWVSNATYTGFKRRVGDTLEVEFGISLGGAPSGTLNLNIPSECTLDTAKTTGSNARNEVGNLLIFDSDTGAQIYGPVQYNNSTSVALNVILTANASTAPISNITATAPITFASGDTIRGHFRVPCVGWAAQTLVMPNAQGWFVSARIGAATDVNLGTTTVAKNEIDQGDMTLTAEPGSASVGIACASGNASPIGGTTCAAGNEVLGITTNIPTSGVYDVCTGATNYIDDGSAAVNTLTLNDFQIDYTSSTSSTALTAGTIAARTALRTNSAGGAEVLGNGFPFEVCQSFVLPAGQATFRTMHTSSISGTLSLNNLQPNSGNMRMTIRPVNSQQQAILANSVSTGTTNGERLGRALISNGSTANCTASPCTVERNSTGFISSATKSATGVYTINFTSGYFSAPPECTYASRDSAAAGSRTFCGLGGASSVTAQTIGCYREDTGVASDVFFSVICIGPR